MHRDGQEHGRQAISTDSGAGLCHYERGGRSPPQRRRSLPAARALRLGRALAAGPAALHRRGRRISGRAGGSHERGLPFRELLVLQLKPCLLILQLRELFDWAECLQRGLLLFMGGLTGARWALLACCSVEPPAWYVSCFSICSRSCEHGSFRQKACGQASAIWPASCNLPLATCVATLLLTCLRAQGIRGALNALLYRTGDQSRDFVVVLATNRPADLDAAVVDR